MDDKFIIPLNGLAAGKNEFFWQADKEFFDSFENAEILDAQLDADVIVEKSGRYIGVDCDVRGMVTVECDRCLDEVRDVFDADFERTVVTRGSLTEEQLEENFDEYAVLDADGMLDVDREIAETMMLLFPKKILCAEDCEGLCPVCGKPKRLGDCGCVTKEIDPRLAILQKLLDNSEK